ncbi:MAG TPA: ribokinase [Anaerolineales bacterium]|nr:ribokinase [Anaerolineales bacterium]
MLENHPSLVVVGSHAPGIAVRVKRIPVPGETAIGWDLNEPQDGGKGSNQAIAAARLGLSTSFVGCIGNDRLGEDCERVLRAEGVDTRYLYHSDSKPTGAGIILLDEDGVPAMVTVAGANDELDFQQVAAALEGLSGARVLLTQFEIQPEVALQSAHLAHRYNMTAIVNPAPAAPVNLDELGVADILVPNEVEAKMLLGIDPGAPIEPENAAKRLRERTNAEVVVVTAGEQGLAGADSQGTWRALPPSVSVVDTSGAGDVFCAAMAAGLIRGMDHRTASQWACIAASLSVTKEGTIPSFPAAAEVNGSIGNR